MSESYKILLVDDEKDILEFLSYNLKKESFIVRTALNGELAIEEAKKFHPDLIILDVMMPEMDGIITCAEIRKISDLESVLILFLTARSEEYSELAGFDAGADDYVTKPIKPKLLIKSLFPKVSGCKVIIKFLFPNLKFSNFSTSFLEKNFTLFIFSKAREPRV